MKVLYKELNEISKDFLNEVYFRTESAKKALDIFNRYKQKKTKDRLDYDEVQSIKYITARFAILELITLFDGTGKLSLKLHFQKDKYSVQVDSLKKFFIQYTETERVNLKKEIDLILIKNRQLLKRMFDTRHEKIAHAVISNYKSKKNYLTSFRFPLSRVYFFASDIQRLFLKISFDLPLDFDKHVT